MSRGADRHFSGHPGGSGRMLLSAIPAVGVVGIWWSVPIGWFLADMTGLLYFKIRKNKLLPLEKASIR